MSDIKLFRILGEDVTELAATGHALEKQLQTFMERSLESLIGIRFVASEHSTGANHGGRIDTLGLDENNSPVIIEYKRSKSENVINQGLFYLDWLMDHKADFALLAMGRLGPEVKDAIDWSGPRLLCIAQDFTRYDEHAVKQMGRNIELYRYRRYGDDFLLLELVNAAEQTSSDLSAGGSGGLASYKTVDEYLAGSPDGLRLLFDELRTQVTSLGDDVQVKHLKHYIAFRRIRNFATVVVHPQVMKLLVYVRLDPDSIDLQSGFTRDVRNVGHLGTGDLEITIDSSARLQLALPLLERSYADS